MGNARRFSNAGVQRVGQRHVQTHLVKLPKKTGSSGQCCVIGLCGLFRKEVCGWKNMQIISKKKKRVRVPLHVVESVTETSLLTHDEPISCYGGAWQRWKY